MFRSSQVDVKYFDENTTSSMVETDARILKQCCHLNMPVIYRMNNQISPQYIVMQIYWNDGVVATLHTILSESGTQAINGQEHWLLFVSEVVDTIAYVHKKIAQRH